MFGGTIKVVTVLTALVSLAIGETQTHGHFRGDSMALVVSEGTQDEVNDSCFASNGHGCHRRLAETAPEFIPTHEWQDILPNQAIPPVDTLESSVWL
ncbi:hypothetical protein DVH05_025114 [Phytophthora capsici]|nr:hypothetical protein DVH05_025114 [Phytophthora capsici]